MLGLFVLSSFKSSLKFVVILEKSSYNSGIKDLLTIDVPHSN